MSKRAAIKAIARQVKDAGGGTPIIQIGWRKEGAPDSEIEWEPVQGTPTSQDDVFKIILAAELRDV